VTTVADEDPVTGIVGVEGISGYRAAPRDGNHGLVAYDLSPPPVMIVPVRRPFENLVPRAGASRWQRVGCRYRRLRREVRTRWYDWRHRNDDLSVWDDEPYDDGYDAGTVPGATLTADDRPDA
jgi:hypothetical protein